MEEKEQEIPPHPVDALIFFLELEGAELDRAGLEEIRAYLDSPQETDDDIRLGLKA